jgi:hypothetical protein
MGDERIVERLEDGEWVRIDFMDLKMGDEFRLYEANGTLVDHGKGGSIALCDVYLNDDGVGTVMVDYD